MQEHHKSNTDGITQCTTDYRNFCMDIIVSVRTASLTTRKVKLLLNLKRNAFKDGDKAELYRFQKELKFSLKQTKETYRWKMEMKLKTAP